MIESGTLEKHPAKLAFEILHLGTKDLPAIMDLQELTWQRLQKKDLLEKISREEMALHFGERGFTIGAIAAGQLIGFCNAYLPGTDKHEWTLGYDIGLHDPADLNRTANCQMVCVHPHFRGYALGRRLLEHVVKTFRGYRRFVHLCATASPYNLWSLDVLLRCGFSLRNVKMKYGGKLRYIAYRNILQPLRFAENRQEAKTTRLTDINGQEALMAQGLMGIGIRRIGGHDAQPGADGIEAFEVVFAKPSNWMEDNR
jgi:ribosomal protein S18 acetylase RimI-like enzyme